MMLWGRDITAHQYSERVAPTDLAKSIGSIFGVDAGGAETRVLPCMPAAELEKVLRAALAKAPKFEHLIPGEKLAPEARGVTAFAEMPAEGLPAGYARLEKAEINGDTATVALWYGPIPPPPPPGVVQLACGSGYTYQLQRDASGEWQVKSFGITVC